MKTIMSMFIFLAFALTAATTAITTRQSMNFAHDGPFDDDSFYHHGYALVETWIGRAAINASDLTGSQMFDAIYQGLARECRQDYPRCYQASIHNIQTHVVRDLGKGEVADAYIGFTVNGEFSSDENRVFLIEMVAATMQALTETGTSENCYAVPGHQKFCNVGDLVRINLPTVSGAVDHRNYLHIQLHGDTVTGEFKCCPTRYKVDQGLDKFGQDVQNGFQSPWSRDTRCLIWGSYICESCGSRCDSCGAQCPDVCPNGKCEG